MKLMHNLAAALLIFSVCAAHAQIPVAPNPDHEVMLRSANPQLAKNKRFVYDFWREVFEAAHMDVAPGFIKPGQCRRFAVLDARASSTAHTAAVSDFARPLFIAAS